MSLLGVRLAPLALLIPAAFVTPAESASTPSPALPPPARSVVLVRDLERSDPAGSLDPQLLSVADEIESIASTGGSHDDYVGLVRRMLTPLHDAVMVDNEEPWYELCWDPVEERYWRYCHEVSTLMVCDLDDPRGPIAVKLGTTIFLEGY